MVINVKEVQLNNKSRKGTYIYIKEAGQRPKYFKKKNNLKINAYVEFYKRKLITKRGGVSLEKIEQDKKISRQFKKYAKIDDMFKSGEAISEYTINNAKNLTPQKMNIALKNLLMNKNNYMGKGKVVKDNLLANVLAKPDIAEKWKSRVMFEVELLANNGQILMTVNNTQIKTLAEIKKEVIDKINIGMEFSGSSNEIVGIIKDQGYKVNMGGLKKGNINKIKIKMTFRKK